MANNGKTIEVAALNGRLVQKGKSNWHKEHNPDSCLLCLMQRAKEYMQFEEWFSNEGKQEEQ